MDHRLPDGPASPAMAQALAYHRDPLGVLRRTQARYGPVFTLRFPAKEPLVFVALPEALSAVLDADPDRAHAGEARRAVLPQASPCSPFGGDEQAHRTSRARMWPGLCPERIGVIEPAIGRLAEEHVAHWPLGRPFRLLEATRSLCTHITVHLVLGVTDPQRRRALVAAILRMLNTPGNPPLPLPGEEDGPGAVLGRLGDRLFAQRSAEVRRLMSEELIARRSRGEATDDLLGVMLQSKPPPSDEEIINELLIVLMAAQEPPAIALANVLYELGGHPDVDEQFLADPAGRRAIIAEAMRLRPSAQAALRKLTEPMPLDGHVLPSGTLLACPSLLLHRDPTCFPEPDTFRRERFSEGTPPEAPYLPFGGGARRCVGEALAEAEFRAVLPVAVKRLRFTHAWPRDERMVVRATVLVPQHSALVIAERRSG